MYKISTTNKFEKDVVKCVKRNLNISELEIAVSLLELTGTLTNNYKPHPLKGNYIAHWECHIKPDWLLIWFPLKNEKEITLVRTGTHSELFK